ncbi:MAG: acyl-CoA dehydrogenase family protein [Chloroflexi bacterium]|nr:acyl-CoA dehydrogenase family protein [Chloroflexota bacterium]
MTTVQPVVEAARALEPTVRAQADQIEREGRLPEGLVRALSEAGVFRMLVPKALGGLEVDPVTQLDVLEAISRGDGSAGWVSAIASGTAWTMAFLPPETAAEILADPHAIVVGTLGAPSGGRAVEVDGGYQLTGRWPFGSGSLHASWLVSRAVVYSGEAPKLDANGQPVTRVLVFPAAQATIIGTWDVTGLTGTGSHDYSVDDIFVPAVRSFGLSGEPSYHPGPLYLGRFFLLAHGAHAVGVARAAVDTLRETVRDKRQTGAGGDALVRDRPDVQLAVAQAEALVRAARAYLWETTQQVWDEACATGAIGAENRALARLANSASFDMALRAVDLAYSAGGGSAIYRRNPLQRYFRDIHTASQHSVVAASSLTQIGGALLAGSGLDRLTGRPLL